MIIDDDNDVKSKGPNYSIFDRLADETSKLKYRGKLRIRIKKLKCTNISRFTYLFDF